ncbi:hypothetical protein SLEP1_g5786 [Rubroshorea leprosula]|nr:hypothetical protein SLEP1_g5786 [Rubroshorea leprosula]
MEKYSPGDGTSMASLAWAMWSIATFLLKLQLKVSALKTLHADGGTRCSWLSYPLDLSTPSPLTAPGTVLLG